MPLKGLSVANGVGSGYGLKVVIPDDERRGAVDDVEAPNPIRAIRATRKCPERISATACASVPDIPVCNCAIGATTQCPTNLIDIRMNVFFSRAPIAHCSMRVADAFLRLARKRDNLEFRI